MLHAADDGWHMRKDNWHAARNSHVLCPGAAGSCGHQKAVNELRLKALRMTMSLAAACAFALCLAAGAMAQAPMRPGLDTPRVRVAVADFRPVGAEGARATTLSDQLQRALAAHPQVQVIAGDEVRSATAEAEDDVMRMVQGAARALGDRLGVDAVVYGRLVADVSELLEDPAPVAEPFVQVVVAETLTLEGQLHPGVPVAPGEATDLGEVLAGATLPLLPAAGRVLSIIDSPEGIAIQLFPLGGRVLAADAEYAVYDPVQFRVAVEDTTGAGEALARQDLRLGTATGRVRTAPDADDHAVSAVSTDPAGRVTVGQLVGLTPAPGAPGPAPMPLLLVAASPADAVVFLDGRVAGLAPVALPLQAGRPVKITLARRDHTPAEYDVTATEGEGLAMAVPLPEIPPFGHVRIVTNPPGAVVTVDGEELGKTPLTSGNMAAGEHQFVVALEGFKPIAHTVAIRRQRTTELNFNLQKDLRRIRIVSEPEGARLFLNGEPVGSTPTELAAVQTGEHEVRLTLPGHAMVQETLTVKPDDEVQSFAFRLRALAGNLRIETDPPGASVSLDGQDRGKTPVAVTGLAIGQHQVTLNMEGYLPVNKTVEVMDQQTTAVRETLAQAAGSILCVSVPAGARIMLDGQDMGVTPRTLDNVPVGRRLLTLSLAGYEQWTARVPVAHGETTRVEVGLIRDAQTGLRRAQ